MGASRRTPLDGTLTAANVAPRNSSIEEHLMPSIGSGGRFHRTAAIALAVVSTLVIAAPALAKSGNSAAAAACQNGGYLDWTDVAHTPFRNTGACVSYAAHGGTLIAVVVEPVNPFSVSYRAAGSNGFQATVTGSGLEPDSSVDVFFTWGGTTSFFGDVANGSGEVAFTASGACVSLGSPLTEVAVAGTPAGGEQTEYPVPLPDASICPP